MIAAFRSETHDSPVRTGFPKVPAILLTAALTLTGALPSSARLGSIENPPWIGYFAAYTDKRFTFGMTSKGEIQLTVLKREGEPVVPKLVVPIVINIEEVLPDGRTVGKEIDPMSLESGQPPSPEFENFTIRGKAAGDASFEVTFARDKGEITMGGRVIDSGDATHPVRVSFRADFAAPYPFTRGRSTEKAAKEFEKKIRRDFIEVTTTDKTRRKLEVLTDYPKGAAEERIVVPSVSTAEIDIFSFDGRKFDFVASPGSSMILMAKQRQPLFEGFSLHWIPDPKGTATFSLEVN